MGFFVQTIVVDRYIHRRELRLVSLESLSSVVYGNKKIFFYFRFLQGLIGVLTFEKIERIPLIFFTFSGIFELNFANFAKNLLFICYLFTKNIVGCFFLNFFCQKVWLKFSKFIKLFHQKTAQNKFL